jgi:hypothetical protein
MDTYTQRSLRRSLRTFQEEDINENEEEAEQEEEEQDNTSIRRRKHNHNQSFFLRAQEETDANPMSNERGRGKKEATRKEERQDRTIHPGNVVCACCVGFFVYIWVYGLYILYIAGKWTLFSSSSSTSPSSSSPFHVETE